MSDPLSQWLAAQRELTERWLAQARDQSVEGAESVRLEAQRWWQQVLQQVSPPARELALQLAQLGPAFFAGSGEALFELFGAGGVQDAANPARWMQMAPLGYFREQQADVQALAKALAEYHRALMDMSATVTQVHATALELLAERLQPNAEPIADSARLYAMWIECGEQAFAQTAHGEPFVRLQGQLMNAAVRLRAAQQALAEHYLKSLDLPARAELNSVHKRLKDLRERIEQLEARAARE